MKAMFLITICRKENLSLSLLHAIQMNYCVILLCQLQLFLCLFVRTFWDSMKSLLNVGIDKLWCAWQFVPVIFHFVIVTCRTSVTNLTLVDRTLIYWPTWTNSWLYMCARVCVCGVCSRAPGIPSHHDWCHAVLFFISAEKPSRRATPYLRTIIYCILVTLSLGTRPRGAGKKKSIGL